MMSSTTGALISMSIGYLLSTGEKEAEPKLLDLVLCESQRDSPQEPRHRLPDLGVSPTILAAEPKRSNSKSFARAGCPLLSVPLGSDQI